MSARPRRRSEPLLALFATVLWAASAFAVDGILAVVLDRDPIQSSVSRFAGVTLVVVTGLLVWLVLTFAIARPAPWWGMVLAAAAGYLGPVLASIPTGLGLAFEQAVSPFVFAEALVAAAVALAAWAVRRRARIAAEGDPRTREW